MGYIESIDDGRRFLKAAKDVTLRKPVVLLKAGSTASAPGPPPPTRGALPVPTAPTPRRSAGGDTARGSIEELFDFTVGFSMQPVPKQGKLLILTNAGAGDPGGGHGGPPGDPSRRGLRVAARAIAPKVPPTSSLVNPVDIIGDARADRYRDVLNILAGDDSVDMVLVLLTPQVMTEPEETARAVVSELGKTGKTVFGSFVGGTSVASARKVLMEGGVPSYITPERAVGTAHAMVRYSRIQTADFPEDGGSLGGRPMAAQRAIGRILGKGGQGGEEDARSILEVYGFSFPKNSFAQTSADAVQAYREMGVPQVVMKIVSPQILHKTDVGGVRLGLASEQDVERAFVEITASVRRHAPDAWIAGVSVQEMIVGGQELILGLTRDPQFGPLLMFGLGGIYVEVLKDVAFRVAPVSRRDAAEMIREIRAYPLLAGYRGTEPADEEAIIDAMLRLSALSCDFPEIMELDINPSGDAQGQGASGDRLPGSGSGGQEMNLYIASTSEYAGKTLVALALGKIWGEAGVKVGYLKILGKIPVMEDGKLVDEDASFIANQLGLEGPPEAFCPAVITPDLVMAAYRGEDLRLRGKITASVRDAEARSEILLVGGTANARDGYFFGLPRWS
jgi:acetyltransferase